jgi:hypothetical protein
MAIKLEEHKVYVDSHKMEMVPLTVAIEAVNQALNPDIEKYTEELENAMEELRNSLNNISIDD